MLACITALALVFSGCASGQNDNNLQSRVLYCNQAAQNAESSSSANTNLDAENGSSSSNSGTSSDRPYSADLSSGGQSDSNGRPTVPALPPTGSASLSTSMVSEEENHRRTIEMVVNGKTFTAVLYDNETAKAFAERLPLTLDMSEMNGNEKYYYFEERLPADPRKPGKIDNGDLMLYGTDCVVLFYKSVSTSYSYTPLGHVDNPASLARALGSGAVTVTFQVR